MFTPLLRSLALLPLLLAPSGETPHFAPEQGSRLRKIFREEVQVELDSFERRIDDEESPEADIEITLKGNRQITVTDEYVALADGRVQRLRREFGELRGELEGESNDSSGENSFDVSGGSELEDAVVLFELEDDSYTASFDVKEGQRAPDSSLLAGLHEDMDLRACLPADEVEEGDSWDIDAAAFADVLSPGGFIDLTYGDVDSGDVEPALLLSHLLVGDGPQEMSGTVKGTWLAAPEGEESQIARIALEIDVQCTSDLRERTRVAAEAKGIDPGQSDGLKRFDLEGTWKGQGVVEWDMAAGRVHASSLEGEVVFHLEIENHVGPDQAMVFEIDMEFTGTSRLTLVTEAP